MKIEFDPKFKKDWEKLFHWKYAPLRALEWILGIPREIKWFFQRGFRGYSDQDVWGLYDYIQGWLPAALRDLAKQVHGCPTSFAEKYEDVEKGSEQWKATLLEMAGKIEASRKWELLHESFESVDGEENWEIAMNRAYKETEEGLEMFKKYFHSLWD